MKYMKNREAYIMHKVRNNQWVRGGRDFIKVVALELGFEGWVVITLNICSEP